MAFYNGIAYELGHPWATKRGRVVIENSVAPAFLESVPTVWPSINVDVERSIWEAQESKPPYTGKPFGDPAGAGVGGTLSFNNTNIGDKFYVDSYNDVFQAEGGVGADDAIKRFYLDYGGVVPPQGLGRNAVYAGGHILGEGYKHDIQAYDAPSFTPYPFYKIPAYSTFPVLPDGGKTLIRKAHVKYKFTMFKCVRRNFIRADHNPQNGVIITLKLPYIKTVRTFSFTRNSLSGVWSAEEPQPPVITNQVLSSMAFKHIYSSRTTNINYVAFSDEDNPVNSGVIAPYAAEEWFSYLEWEANMTGPNSATATLTWQNPSEVWITKEVFGVPPFYPY